MTVGRDEQAAALATALRQPGLSVVTGGPGAGKSALVLEAAARAGRPVAHAGALATLRHVPGLPLARALRARVPTDDVLLAVEAVRARLGAAVLVVDDAHWADRLTLAALPELARHCRVVATVRMPGPLTAPALEDLRAAAACWLDLAPLADGEAAGVVRAARPELPEAVVADVVARAGGNPLALRVLADRAAGGHPGADALRGIAEMVADLPQDERTALAALGLLGRPAGRELLGPGGAGLLRSGLAEARAGLVEPRERLVAEVAAGVLPDGQRRAMHRRLAELVGDDGEAARHLRAAGDAPAAVARARQAAADAATAGERAEHLLFAVACLGAGTEPVLALEAADAALAAGLFTEARRLAEPLAAPDATCRVHRAVVLAESVVALGGPDPAALAEVVPELGQAPPELRARHAVASVYLTMRVDPDVACALAEYALAESGAGAPARLHAAAGAALLTAGRAGWEGPVRTAMAAAAGAGDLAGECTAGTVLVEGLRDACRTAEAREVSAGLAERCARQGAYSWEVAFRAESLWAALHAGGGGDDVVRLAATLLDRAAPRQARELLVATLALAHADAGAIPTARELLDGTPGHDRVTTWVGAEAAWLDGDRAAARELADALADGPDLPADLARITRVWCDADDGEPRPPDSAGLDAGRPPVRATLHAFAGADAARFQEAARTWDGVMVRERVRCLLAAGHGAAGIPGGSAGSGEPGGSAGSGEPGGSGGSGEPGGSGDVEALLEAERVASDAGLVLLLGRVRRALRRHGIQRRPAAPARPGGLSPREFEALRLVGQGHSTRRIAELLGLTRHTAETYIKQGMSKLGARTRTEAAVRAAAMTQPSEGAR